MASVFTVSNPLFHAYIYISLARAMQLKASLAEQLSVDQLREEFRRYIKTKVAQELVDFYLDSLDREEVTGFFERQVTSQACVRYTVPTKIVFIGAVMLQSFVREKARVRRFVTGGIGSCLLPIPRVGDHEIRRVAFFGFPDVNFPGW